MYVRNGNWEYLSQGLLNCDEFGAVIQGMNWEYGVGAAGEEYNKERLGSRRPLIDVNH